MVHLNAATTEALVDFVQGFTLDPPKKLHEDRLAPAPKPDDTSVTLRGVSVPLNSDVGGAFVSDAARNRQRLFSDQRLCEKYGLSMDAWTEIAKNPAFRLAVDAEHERRVFNGDAARESAAKIFSESPSVLGAILNDKSASPKHRIDAARELRATAQPGTEKARDDSDRFVISINLGADQKILIDKEVRPLTAEEAKEQLDAE
jgi:hypothetical protein